jgi:hypothetical protein
MKKAYKSRIRIRERDLLDSSLKEDQLFIFKDMTRRQLSLDLLHNAR